MSGASRQSGGWKAWQPVLTIVIHPGGDWQPLASRHKNPETGFNDFGRAS